MLLRGNPGVRIGTDHASCLRLPPLWSSSSLPLPPCGKPKIFPLHPLPYPLAASTLLAVTPSLVASSPLACLTSPPGEYQPPFFYWSGSKVVSCAPERGVVIQIPLDRRKSAFLPLFFLSTSFSSFPFQRNLETSLFTRSRNLRRALMGFLAAGMIRVNALRLAFLLRSVLLLWDDLRLFSVSFSFL